MLIVAMKINYGGIIIAKINRNIIMCDFFMGPIELLELLLLLLDFLIFVFRNIQDDIGRKI